MMYRIVIMLAIFNFLTEPSFSQTPSYSGKTFVSKKIKSIEFLTDSNYKTDENSISYLQYKFKDDSLLVSNWQFEMYPGKALAFKVLKKTADTLSFVFVAGNGSQDTMEFLNIQKLIVPITNFEFFRVDVYGFQCLGRIIVKNDKTVYYAPDCCSGPLATSVKYRVTKLSDQQYQEFLDMLSKSFIFQLPEKRGTNKYDPTYFDFMGKINNRTIVSKGCDLSAIHYKLIEYLYQTVVKRY
ncbi:MULTISPECIES: hypothetical protein [unclassified Paraflavitalea]|uniref:hypothetical protein n=1 Tax=unclassified Paraflavitalea TaxID=2798305 RepID=UPI003D3356BA